ncbi:hypothetical protein [Methylobacterium tardum]|uniref:hypothetical protein n=1 Tax=Methylobacterium tardum TaxID=374432 RepID=UPI001EE134F7|nr:hypothetical protein [Methylobacterium tardum]URD39470.1 hypothetical protein M6G65_14295 [Methylobacterium tardum]
MLGKMNGLRYLSKRLIYFVQSSAVLRPAHQAALHLKIRDGVRRRVDAEPPLK